MCRVFWFRVIFFFRSESPRRKAFFSLLWCFPPTALNGSSARKRCKVGLRRVGHAVPVYCEWILYVVVFPPLALPCLQSKLPLINLNFPLHSTSLLLFTWLIQLHFLSPLKSASAPVPGGLLDLNNSERHLHASRHRRSPSWHFSHKLPHKLVKYQDTGGPRASHAPFHFPPTKSHRCFLPLWGRRWGKRNLLREAAPFALA